ncbi:MAG: FAD-dependent oxidoreductase [Saprospiraceae bacterium]|nr:FAD-dependent oxidoreductase [Saprospiraceae bacterium]
MKVTIIGGGIIGLSTAYYLAEAGIETTVVDRNNLEDGCSFGNAGMIVPSHFIPLAAPGVIRQGLKWLLDDSSPFYIKPRMDVDLVRWLYLFSRSANTKKAELAMPLLRDLNQLSKKLYQELNNKPGFNFGWQEKGILMLFQEAATQKEEEHTARRANQLGIEANVLSSNELSGLEPGVPMDVLGAVHYPGDAHLTPHLLMQNLIRHLRHRGVHFIQDTNIEDFRFSGRKVQGLLTDQGQLIEVDQLVVASGSWSGLLGKKLGIPLALQGGKGYSLTVSDLNNGPSIPSILVEARVAMTPMQHGLRIAGTLEIAGLNTAVNTRRVQGILEAVPRYYPQLPVKTSEGPVWSGYRPCTPDGLPYLGKHEAFENLYLNTGHAMMGLSLGPASGLLMKEILLRERPSLPLERLHPGRFN